MNTNLSSRDCRILKKLAKLFQPKPPLSVSQWAELYAYLPREGNAEPGKYRLSRMPYQEAMLDDVIDPTVNETVWMIASQLGKTACIVIIVSYFIDQDPTAILVVYPTIDSGKSWVREKFEPALKETPVLAGKIKESRARDSENTALNKKFAGGNITIAGANSPSGLRQRSKRVVVQDEIDAFEPNAEGDPCKQADKRAETFHNAVKLKSSTPTRKGVSRVEAKFEVSDKQYRFCPCPKCGTFQHLKWRQVRWPEGKPEEAFYECENDECRAQLTDQDRIAMIHKGEWRATAPFNGIRGRHLNGIYRLIGKKKAYRNYLHEFAVGFLEAQREGKHSLMVWVNTFLAETWEEEAEKIESGRLMDRREEYGPELPDEVLLLTCGVDVQKDRFEIEVDGWGPGEESWGVQYKTIPGDTLNESSWQKLDEFLQTSKWKTKSGVELSITATCIDSAYPTDEVLRFCKPRFGRRIFAVKGGNQPGQPVVGLLSRNNRRRCPVYRIGTDTAKDIIYGRLRMEEHGPGFLHYPLGKAFGFDSAYFSMLTAEEVRTEMRRGFPKRFYYKTRPRNEGIDLRVYSLAALAILQPNWSALSKNLDRQPKSYALNKPPEPERAQSEGAVEVKPAAKPRAPVFRPFRKTNFATSWKKY